MASGFGALHALGYFDKPKDEPKATPSPTGFDPMSVGTGWALGTAAYPMYGTAAVRAYGPTLDDRAAAAWTCSYCGGSRTGDQCEGCGAPKALSRRKEWR